MQDDDCVLLLEEMALPMISGVLNNKILAKHLETSFSAFLGCFRAFLKAYLRQLIQTDLFGFFSCKFRPQKILGNRILYAEFPSSWLLSEKILADLILHSKRLIFPSQNNSHPATKVRRDV